MADPVDKQGPDLAIAVRLLAHAQLLPPALVAALEGPLSDPTATAPLTGRRELSDATKQAYRRDWIHFNDWARQQDVDPATVPIHPVLVAAYLASLAGTLGPSALNGRLAAIAHEHRRRGLTWNAGHPAIRETLRGIERSHGRPVRPAAALTSADIGQLLATCEGDVAGLRDRALFLVGVTGALRRSALVAIDHGHLRFDAGHVTIHHARAENAADGASVTLPRQRDPAGGISDTCPVQALERWLARAKIRRGPVFRNVTTGGRLGDRLSPDGVRHILLSRAKRAGLTVPPGFRLSPNGLRKGLAATDIAVRGRPSDDG